MKRPYSASYLVDSFRRGPNALEQWIKEHGQNEVRIMARLKYAKIISEQCQNAADVVNTEKAIEFLDVPF